MTKILTQEKVYQELWLNLSLVEIAWERLIEEHGFLQAYYYKCLISYYQIRFTEPLLKAASHYSVGKLQKYFVTHLKEERGHYKFAKDDLKFIRNIIDNKDVDWIESKLLIRNLIRRIHSDIESRNFCYFFAYMISLECFPPKFSYWSEKCVQNNISTQAISSIQLHSKSDIQHSSDLIAVVSEQFTDLELEKILNLAKEILNIINNVYRVKLNVAR